MIAKCWAILANCGCFVANLRTLWCTFTGLNNAVVYQNWQIWGMSTFVIINCPFCLGIESLRAFETIVPQALDRQRSGPTSECVYLSCTLTPIYDCRHILIFLAVSLFVIVFPFLFFFAFVWRWGDDVQTGLLRVNCLPAADETSAMRLVPTFRLMGFKMDSGNTQQRWSSH